MSAETQVNLPDGNIAELPEYAMESTMRKMLDTLKAMHKLDGRDTSTLEDLLRQTRDANTKNQKSAQEADSDRDKQLELLRQINASAQRSTLLSTDSLVSGLKMATGALTSFAEGVTGLAAGALSMAIQGTQNLGNAIRDLTDVGVGFDTSDTRTITMLANMQSFGMTLDQSVNTLHQFSMGVQVFRRDFLDMANEFVGAGDFARQFGLTIAESVELLAEDLENRARIGLISEISAVRQAELSQELFENQIEATRMLGVSIDKIRQSGQSFAESNVSYMLLLARMQEDLNGDEVLKFNNAMQSAIGGLVGAGASQGIAERFMAAIFDPITAMANDPEMYGATMALRQTGIDLTSEAQSIQASIKAGDFPGAMAQFNKLKDTLLDMSGNLGKGGQRVDAILNQLSKSNGALAELIPAFARMKGASIGLNGGLDGLAQAVTVAENAFSTIKGVFGGAFAELMGSLSGPLSTLAKTFTASAEARDAEGFLIDKNGKRMTKMVDLLDVNGNVVGKHAVGIKNLHELTEEQADQLELIPGLMYQFRNAIMNAAKVFSGALSPGAQSVADMMKGPLKKGINSFSNWLNRVAKSLGAFLNSKEFQDDPGQAIKDKIAETVNSAFSKLGEKIAKMYEEHLKPKLIQTVEDLKQGFINVVTDPLVISGLVAGFATLIAAATAPIVIAANQAATAIRMAAAAGGNLPMGPQAPGTGGKPKGRMPGLARGSGLLAAGLTAYDLYQTYGATSMDDVDTQGMKPEEIEALAEQFKDERIVETTGAVAGMAGMYGGAKVGATLGAGAGPIGIAIGGLIGGSIGYFMARGGAELIAEKIVLDPEMEDVVIAPKFDLDERSQQLIADRTKAPEAVTVEPTQTLSTLDASTSAAMALAAGYMHEDSEAGEQISQSELDAILKTARQEQGMTNVTLDDVVAQLVALNATFEKVEKSTKDTAKSNKDMANSQ